MTSGSKTRKVVQMSAIFENETMEPMLFALDNNGQMWQATYGSHCWRWRLLPSLPGYDAIPAPTNSG
jgi:hypothetical protein